MKTVDTTDHADCEMAGGASPATQKRYRAVRHKHHAFCLKRGVESWNSVDANHVRDYGDHLAKRDYAARSLYLEMNTLKSVHKFLIQEKLLPESLRIHLSLSRPQGSDTHPYSVDQVRAMVVQAETTGLKWLAEIILILACTGLRIGELASPRWTDIKHDAAGVSQWTGTNELPPATTCCSSSCEEKKNKAESVGFATFENWPAVAPTGNAPGVIARPL